MTVVVVVWKQKHPRKYLALICKSVYSQGKLFQRDATGFMVTFLRPLVIGRCLSTLRVSLRLPWMEPAKKCTILGENTLDIKLGHTYSTSFHGVYTKISQILGLRNIRSAADILPALLCTCSCTSRTRASCECTFLLFYLIILRGQTS